MQDIGFFCGTAECPKHQGEVPEEARSVGPNSFGGRGAKKKAAAAKKKAAAAKKKAAAAEVEGGGCGS
jgi:hypothetical protein